MLIKKGQKFNSLKELNLFIEKYTAEHPGNALNMVNTVPWSQDDLYKRFKYRYLTLKCERAGIPPIQKKRKCQSKKCGCEMFIKISPSKNKNNFFLFIDEMNLAHNEECNRRVQAILNIETIIDDQIADTHSDEIEEAAVPLQEEPSIQKDVQLEEDTLFTQDQELVQAGIQVDGVHLSHKEPIHEVAQFKEIEEEVLLSQVPMQPVQYIEEVDGIEEAALLMQEEPSIQKDMQIEEETLFTQDQELIQAAIQVDGAHFSHEEPILHEVAQEPMQPVQYIEEVDAQSKENKESACLPQKFPIQAVDEKVKNIKQRKRKQETNLQPADTVSDFTEKKKKKKKNLKKKKEEKMETCKVCGLTADDDTVLCEVCDRWFHFKCTDYNKSDVWSSCILCKGVLE